MPLLDTKGRLFGKLNLFDLFLVVAVVTLVVLGYQWLAVSHRVAPPYALDSTAVTVRLDLQLPRDRAWLCDAAVADLQETDPRTGEPRARVLGCEMHDDRAIVRLEVHAVQDGAGRVIYRGMPLLPGRELRFETDAVILDGVVRKLDTDGQP